MARVWHECLHYASYYAPRGRPRLLTLGGVIGQRYLAPEDKLIGIIGEPGTGKSSLIRGMFPGLELTNDDRGVNVRPVPLLQHHADGTFRAATYHIDVRFESAFAQSFEMAAAVKGALAQGRRVVVEHFDLLYPVLGINAECVLAIGEEIVVARPNVFGPTPEKLMSRVAGTARVRRMAHSAEDITVMILKRDYGLRVNDLHSDVHHGFVIEFDRSPDAVDLDGLEKKVLDIIAADVEIGLKDEGHICIGDEEHPCTGPRIHVKKSGEIGNFRLIKKITFDQINGVYCLIGLVGDYDDEVVG